ncbi:MAG: tetratricopeptide repeat protein [Bacteroidota bacterium]
MKQPNPLSYAQAYHLYQTGNYSACLKLCKKALSQNPEQTDFYAMMGYIYHHQKDFEAAYEAFQKAVFDQPNNPFYLAGWAGTCVGLKKLDEGRKLAEASIKCGADIWCGYMAMAAVEMHTGNSDKALEYVESGLSLSPNNLSLLNMRAILLLQNQRPKEGEQINLDALAQAPVNTNNLTSRALFQLNQGKLKEAEQSLKDALTFNPHNMAAQRNYWRLKNPFMRTWLFLNSEQPIILHTKGIVRLLTVFIPIILAFYGVMTSKYSEPSDIMWPVVVLIGAFWICFACPRVYTNRYFPSVFIPSKIYIRLQVLAVCILLSGLIWTLASILRSLPVSPIEGPMMILYGCFGLALTSIDVPIKN